MGKRRKKSGYYFWKLKHGFTFGPIKSKLPFSWEFSTYDEDRGWLSATVTGQGVLLSVCGFVLFQGLFWRYWTVMGLTLYPRGGYGDE